MGRLACVVGDDLDRVLEGAELDFGSLVEDWQLLRCGKDFVEVVAGSSEV